MRGSDSFVAQSGDRAILPWKFVAGAFIHLVIPAYLIAVAIDCLFASPPHPTLAQLLAIALPFSGRFLAAYAGVTLLASIGARVIDPLLRARRARRMLTDPAVRAIASASRVRAAIVGARTMLGAGAPSTLAAIAAAGWDHHDPHYQAISRDLAKIVNAMREALASALPDGRHDIVTASNVALSAIAAALEDLAQDRRRLDEGDLQTLSRYVEARYGGGDFTGRADS